MIMYDNCMFAYKVKVQQVKNESPKRPSTSNYTTPAEAMSLFDYILNTVFSGCLVSPKSEYKTAN